MLEAGFRKGRAVVRTLADCRLFRRRGRPSKRDVTEYSGSRTHKAQSKGRAGAVSAGNDAMGRHDRSSDCNETRVGIQVRPFGAGVGGLIQAAVGLAGGTGVLLTKRSGFARNA